MGLLKIAVSGKGGVGKTTIAAGLASYFAHNGFRVYAIDADPDACLGTALGLPEDMLVKLKPIVELREVILDKTGGEGSFFSLNPEVDELLDQYTYQQGNLLFLKMGAVKLGGTACYCRENTVLNALLNTLLLAREEVVILDMSAGIEHLTRGTARGVNLMLVVTEPGKLSVQTALRVQQLAQQLGVPAVRFIGNKIRNDLEVAYLRASLPASDLLGWFPFNDILLEGAMNPVLPVIRQALEGDIETIARLIIRDLNLKV